MENQKLTLQDYRNQIKFFKTKLAFKAPKQDFSELILHNVAEVTKVNLRIVSKLTGINSDRIDWYCIEVSGTFDDLSECDRLLERIGNQRIFSNLSFIVA
jgi:hypothetical protein